MALTSAMTNLPQFLSLGGDDRRGRPTQRQHQHQLLPTSDGGSPRAQSSSAADDSFGVPSGGPIPATNDDHSDGDVIAETVPDDEDVDGELTTGANSSMVEVDIENQAGDAGRGSSSAAVNDAEAGAGAEDADGRTRAAASTSRRTITVADLQEEREHIRRRTSACVLLAVFILFRLWVQALSSGDFGLMMLCMFGTHFTARFIRATRDREEELERMMREVTENAENGEIDRNSLRMMSFQAQLALAIMESQRQMMEGGFGHPDGHAGASGVSDEAKEEWDRFEYESATHAKASGIDETKKKGEYGSVAQNDNDGRQFSKDDTEEEPHCSICLGEYEDGENLVSLPCKHVYHADCITSWTDNHTRCPLCNFDLAAVTHHADSSANANSDSSNNTDNDAEA